MLWVYLARLQAAAPRSAIPNNLLTIFPCSPFWLCSCPSYSLPVPVKGFKVAPKKGHAVLFYNLLEDGNGDDLALHAALPVHHGEKWLANFWVWDPKMRD